MKICLIKTSILIVSICPSSNLHMCRPKRSKHTMEMTSAYIQLIKYFHIIYAVYMLFPKPPHAKELIQFLVAIQE